jgi:hypothetical protein
MVGAAEDADSTDTTSSADNTGSGISTNCAPSHVCVAGDTPAEQSTQNKAGSVTANFTSDVSQNL